jgi:hypothetical protein
MTPESFRDSAASLPRHLPETVVILSKLPLVIPSEVEEFLTIVQADCVSAWNYLEKAPR